jgi:hypothetical protein
MVFCGNVRTCNIASLTDSKSLFCSFPCSMGTMCTFPWYK